MNKYDQSYISRYLSCIPEFAEQKAADMSPAIQLHLTDPSISAAELGEVMKISHDEIRNLYQQVQADSAIKVIAESPFYPRRMMTALARSIIRDWVSNPDYAQKVLYGEPVMSRTLEIHATKGSCNYTCAMCLWSDKQQLTYAKKKLDDVGLMTNQNWEVALKQAHEMGAQDAVFSGGGEPLLKHDLFDLIRTARQIGLKTHLYTNGFNLDRLSEEDWQEILQMEQVRFSIHSPTADTYDAIVKMPTETRALQKVSENIRELLARRSGQEGAVRVGVGFVAQALNYDQIEQMADFATDLGVDFLNIRQDEVDVTKGLSVSKQRTVAEQLVRVRARALQGSFDTTNVDMSDDLTAKANGVEQTVRAVRECQIKKLRLAISPYGLVGPCDLKVEPRFATPMTILGSVKRQIIPLIIEHSEQKMIPADCAECMPSGRTGNAIFTKILQDFETGIHYADQPFNS